ncbi:MAG: hypothetical protein WCT49_01775 [Candidatus Paceibacterota bacterium]
MSSGSDCLTEKAMDLRTMMGWSNSTARATVKLTRSEKVRVISNWKD